jgi:hypothetical protein
MGVSSILGSTSAANLHALLRFFRGHTTGLSWTISSWQYSCSSGSGSHLGSIVMVGSMLGATFR